MLTGWLLITAIGAGVVGSASGMGGGVVLVPVLTAFGIDIKHAIAVSVLSLLLISNSAGVIYTKRHLPNFRVSAFLEVFGVIGAAIGAVIAVVAVQRILLLACGVIFCVSAVLLLLQRKIGWETAHEQDTWSRWLTWNGSYYDEVEGRTVVYRGNRAGLAGVLIFGAAVVLGALGMGGSAPTVLVTRSVIGLPPKVALTTSHLILSVLSLVCIDVYLETGLLDPQLVAPVIVGVWLGAVVGSRLMVRLANRVVSGLFCCFLVVWGIEMLSRGIQWK